MFCDVDKLLCVRVVRTFLVICLCDTDSMCLCVTDILIMGLYSMFGMYSPLLVCFWI